MKVQKITPADDLEALLNTFERTATTTGWPIIQWVAALIPCLVGLVQQAMDTLPVGEVLDDQSLGHHHEDTQLETRAIPPEAPGDKFWV